MTNHYRPWWHYHRAIYGLDNKMLDKIKIGHDLKNIAREMRKLSGSLDQLFIDLFEDNGDTDVYYNMDYVSCLNARILVPKEIRKCMKVASWSTKRFLVTYNNDTTETIAVLYDQQVYLLNDQGQTIEKL